MFRLKLNADHIKLIILRCVLLSSSISPVLLQTPGRDTKNLHGQEWLKLGSMGVSSHFTAASQYIDSVDLQTP